MDDDAGKMAGSSDAPVAMEWSDEQVDAFFDKLGPAAEAPVSEAADDDAEEEPGAKRTRLEAARCEKRAIFRSFAGNRATPY